MHASKINFAQCRPGLSDWLGVWATFAVISLLTGCVTESNGPIPVGSPTAIVEAVAPVWIVSIDGKGVGRISITDNRTLSISPGTHLFELKYSGTERREFENWRGEHRSGLARKMSRQNIRLSAEVLPGHHYYVHAGVAAWLWKPYLNETAPNTFLEPPPL